MESHPVNQIEIQTINKFKFPDWDYRFLFNGYTVRIELSTKENFFEMLSIRTEIDNFFNNQFGNKWARNQRLEPVEYYLLDISEIIKWKLSSTNNNFFRYVKSIHCHGE